MATPPAASASFLVKRADIMVSIPCFLGPSIRAYLVQLYVAAWCSGLPNRWRLPAQAA
jgi:hypothetical protein